MSADTGFPSTYVVVPASFFLFYDTIQRTRCYC